MTAYNPPAVSWDDLNGVSYDRLYTFDDPLGLSRLDEAYAQKVVLRDGAAVSVSWADSGDVVDGLDTPFARDDYVRSAVAEGWGTSTFGEVWTASTTGIFSTDGTYGLAVPSTANVMYYLTLSDINSNDFDIAMKVQATVFATTSRASAYLIARYQDDNGYLRFRLDFNSSQVLGWGIESRSGGVNTTIASGLITDRWVHKTDSWFWLRAQSNGSSLRVKAWKDGEAGTDIWNGSATDSVWNGFGGKVGAGFLVTGGPIPFNAFRVAKYLSGISQVLRTNNVSTALSLSDNLPSGVTFTDNTGVVEASADLDGPIGVPADVYWSPFRDDQPWHDYPRDVAQVSIVSGAVAPDGYRVTRMFTGQMADTPIDDRSVKLQAISRTRLRLSTLVQPPPVHGRYEGAEATWAIGYALFKSGVYTAPPPNSGTRLYVPFNGSTRPYIPDTSSAAILAYHIYMQRFSAPGVSSSIRPEFGDGPYPGSAAPVVQIDAGLTQGLNTTAGNVRYAPGEDFFSQTANRGRIELWVKATPSDIPNSMDSSTPNLVEINMQNNAGNHTVVLSVDTIRKVSLAINDGVTFVSYGLTTFLPFDSRWHVIMGTWDIGAGTVSVTVDDKREDFAGISASVSNLPPTEDITQKLTVKAYLPIAELRIVSGRFAPGIIAAALHKQKYQVGAVVRRSAINFDGIAEPEPKEAYAYINEIAAGELAMTGFDEYDRFQYLPSPYFVEPYQLIETETLDTGHNMDHFRPARQLSRIFNQVLVLFRQSLVEELWTPVFRITQVIELPPASDTLLTVPLNPNPVELRTLSLSVLSGTDLTTTPPSDVNAINYVSANTAQDGTGTYATSAILVATVDSWDAGNATIRFHNISGNTYWITNNVNQPSLGLAGKALRVADASELVESVSSIAFRGNRLLRADIPIIQSHVDALRLGQALVAQLSTPRITFTADLWGDGRRKPGQVVAVYDRDRTKVSGQYQILGITNSFENENVVQSVVGEQHFGIFTWGETAWGEGVWGA